MQNIHIRRYTDIENLVGCVEPTDRSWALFLFKDLEPALFLRVSVKRPDGTRESMYAPAASVEKGNDEFAKMGVALQGEHLFARTAFALWDSENVMQTAGQEMLKSVLSRGLIQPTCAALEDPDCSVAVTLGAETGSQ